MKSTPKVPQNPVQNGQGSAETPVIEHPATPAQAQPQPTEQAAPAEQPAAPVAEQAAPLPPVNPKVVRIQQLEKHFEHYEQLRKLNVNLTSLKATKDLIREFVFDTEAAESGRYYQAITIKDDRGKEFNTKNPVLGRLLVNNLDEILTAKIKEVENKLLEIPLV